MRLVRVLLLLLLSVTLVACHGAFASVSLRDTGQWSLGDLKASVCRIDFPSGGHGSGVAFLRKDGWTYILTAAHVTEHVGKEQALSLSFSRKDTDIQEVAYVVRSSSTYDLSIVRSMDSLLSLATLQPASLPEPSLGRPVLSLGYPMSAYPVSVGYGEITGFNTGEILHTATIYFGNSGGPLVDFNTGHVIGINVKIKILNQKPRSDRGMAVDLDSIHKFINDEQDERKEYTYQCPLHPESESPFPGRCYICRNPLERKEKK